MILNLTDKCAISWSVKNKKNCQKIQSIDLSNEMTNTYQINDPTMTILFFLSKQSH